MGPTITYIRLGSRCKALDLPDLKQSLCFSAPFPSDIASTLSPSQPVGCQRWSVLNPQTVALDQAAWKNIYFENLLQHQCVFLVASFSTVSVRSPAFLSPFRPLHQRIIVIFHAHISSLFCSPPLWATASHCAGFTQRRSLLFGRELLSKAPLRDSWSQLPKGEPCDEILFWESFPGGKMKIWGTEHIFRLVLKKKTLK